jgi:hypothetical protein
MALARHPKPLKGVPWIFEEKKNKGKEMKG